MQLPRWTAPIWVLLAACGPQGGAPRSERQGLHEGERAYVPKGLGPKLMMDRGRAYAPLDVDDHALHLIFDVATASARGISTIRFHQNVPSRPLFLLDATVTGLRLAGRDVAYRGHVEDPDGQSRLYAIEEDLPAGAPQDLEVRYTLPAGEIRFDGGGVGFLTAMSDLDPVHYLEHWAPAGFEEDQFPLSLHLTVEGATSTHQLFTNGVGGMHAEGEWTLQFPPYFTSSSLYVHLTNQPFALRQVLHHGAARDIPLAAYAANASLADAAVAALPALVQELEATYGPYPHAAFVAYITPGGGGMEHSGATISSLWALSHELAHSWFARGVMPADGRAQWIDEGIVTWRDQGYPKAAAPLMASPTNLADYSPFMRGMPYVVHSDAARLMSEWELLLQPQGGLKPLLRTFFARYLHRIVTTAEFRAFLEQESGLSLEAYFERYVTGATPRWPLAAPPREASPHPLPFTEAELRPLR